MGQFLELDLVVGSGNTFRIGYGDLAGEKRRLICICDIASLGGDEMVKENIRIVILYAIELTSQIRYQTSSQLRIGHLSFIEAVWWKIWRAIRPRYGLTKHHLKTLLERALGLLNLDRTRVGASDRPRWRRQPGEGQGHNRHR